MSREGRGGECSWAVDVVTVEGEVGLCRACRRCKLCCNFYPSVSVFEAGEGGFCGRSSDRGNWMIVRPRQGH